MLSILNMKKAILLSIFVLGFGIASYGQCPMCKTALKSNSANGKPTVGNGINGGILFLLTMPYVLAGTAGLVWYKNSRKRKNA
ncbi:MAG: hypothetical protein IT244_10935 [Bacteroidia bacterium]|nr:hypothetical protein [Bacteroidia bacterium]